MRKLDRTGTLEGMRGMSSTDRLALILRRVDESPAEWLEIASSAALSRRDMETIFTEGVRRGEVSGSSWWFQASVPVIGGPRALELLREATDDDPATVARVIYHASAAILQQDKSLRGALAEIEKTLSRVRG